MYKTTSERIEMVETNRVKILRKKCKMTQKDFSVYLGISLSTLRSWEQGQRLPNEGIIEIIERLVRAEHILVE